MAPTGLSSGYSFQKVGDRYYDPALMCFLTRDTELDQLPYTYCNGDPVNYTDPSGQGPLARAFGVIGAVVVVAAAVAAAPVIVAALGGVAATAAGVYVVTLVVATVGGAVGGG